MFLRCRDEPALPEEGSRCWADRPRPSCWKRNHRRRGCTMQNTRLAYTSTFAPSPCTTYEQDEISHYMPVLPTLPVLECTARLCSVTLCVRPHTTHQHTHMPTHTQHIQHTQHTQHTTHNTQHKQHTQHTNTHTYQENTTQHTTQHNTTHKTQVSTRESWRKERKKEDMNHKHPEMETNGNIETAEKIAK